MLNDFRSRVSVEVEQLYLLAKLSLRASLPIGDEATATASAGVRPRRHNLSIAMKDDARNFITRQLFTDIY